MRIRSIGARLTVWYTSLLTLTFFILGSIAYGLLAHSLLRDMDSALNGVAEVMAQRARTEGTPFFPSDVDALFRRFFGFSPLDRHIDLFDPLGRRDPRRGDRRAVAGPRTAPPARGGPTLGPGPNHSGNTALVDVPGVFLGMVGAAPFGRGAAGLRHEDAN